MKAIPVATEAAAPPEEPAVDLVVFQGFRVIPNTSLNVLAPASNSGVFDLAKIIPPEFSIAHTVRSEYAGTKSLKARDPKVVLTSFTQYESFMGIGRPFNGLRFVNLYFLFFSIIGS